MFQISSIQELAMMISLSAPAHNCSLTVAVSRSVGRTPLHNNVNLTTKPLSFNCNLSSPLHLIPTFSANSASHRSFAISSSTETPVVSEDTINVLDDVQVFDLKGQGVPISDLWKDRKAVVAFARHFGCVLCRIRADYLAAEKDKMDAAGVALVLIGPGSVDQARTFYEQTKFKGEVYADPSYRSYEALKFVSGVTTTFTPGAGLKIIQAYMDGYRQDWELSFEKDTRTRGGWRQGGIIVAGPGKNNITYIHKLVRACLLMPQLPLKMEQNDGKEVIGI
ncbi:thioredoxin-like protein AAED1, chloroplastic isoform X2 [Lycium ferocissimum]|uniref:thioredoxin-like protein AAED1, chloroplastic isoform X2 n=1 Tax=Lycium ferocissimum TaxID=112874 RepID=UPI002815F3AB|nr:thioredoxin-like protein AAED1, chloroplastic isoform X2 [Lycium ferocissimum]